METISVLTIPLWLFVGVGALADGYLIWAIVVWGVGLGFLSLFVRSGFSYARRYELWTDAIVVLEPTRLARFLRQSRERVPFSKIWKVRIADKGAWYDSEGGPGGWTSPGSGRAVWITLNDAFGSPLILTPQDPDAFLEALNKAMDAAKQA
jgi:hypothetical protein